IIHTIEVTPSASGELVRNILNSHNLPKIKRCAYALGKSLATFHQLFIHTHDSQDPANWTTICHRDFSIKNVLFDQKTNKVYFIDNETMSKSQIGNDIRTILV